MHHDRSAQYFHCYATANDKRLYLKDIQNLIRIRNTPHGVDKVILLIAISKVKSLTVFDKLFIRTIRKLFDQHPNIELRSIYFKENIGRDFSSYATLHRRVKSMANNEDYIFFQNRSGIGPYKKSWLASFAHQFNRFDNIAICGSTINFKDHHGRSQDNLPHVQTYAFLTKPKFLNMFGDAFPAESESERLKIILNGEIGLSRFFLEQGLRITCMEWKDKPVSSHCQPICEDDVKIRVKADHAFYHRKYFRRNKKPKVKNPILHPTSQYLKTMLSN
ncbi:hypothetical protein [Echinicola sp. 20G]|uniref:hypothetical protein n=1 Tax=Echinicola sp. 20G TaxID=2781961 RepID=UPI001910827D|nr:hypothetical protein [Echinicola sp. 20G]